MNKNIAMIKNIFICIFILIFSFSFSDAYSLGKKKEDKYAKFFKNKKPVTYDGFIKLHKIDGKIYMEFPKKYSNRDFLYGNVTAKISDFRYCYPGLLSRTPKIISFEYTNDKLVVKQDLSLYETEDDNIKESFKDSKLKSFVTSFDIIAETPNKNGWLVDATDFFVFNSDKSLIPFDPRALITSNGRAKINATLEKNKSRLEDASVFEDNLIVRSELTYKTNVSYGRSKIAKILTVNVNRNLVLLPKNPMTTRYADKRIPLTASSKITFDKTSASKIKKNVLKWRLEPVDVLAHQDGKTTEVKKPIVFYISPEVPKEWRGAIANGITEWNKAFEKIGFKNVLQVRDYPKDDTNFDENNIKYNCIKFAYAPTSNVQASRIVDTRTGEILKVDFIIPKNIGFNIHFGDCLYLGDIDPKYNKIYGKNGWVNTERMQSRLKYQFATLTGRIVLSYGAFPTASEAYSYDKLRDPAFTAKNGLSPTLLDNAPYNTTALSGDAEKGIMLENPGNLGVYDYFITKWVYKPIYNKTQKEEKKILNSWITEHNGDKRFQYLYKTRGTIASFPDLGDDPVKMFLTTKKRVKAAIKNIDKWYSNEDDYDYTLRGLAYAHHFKKYSYTLMNLASEVVRVDLIDAKSYKDQPFVKWKTKKQQLRYAKVFLNEVDEFIHKDCWYENPVLEKRVKYGLNNLLNYQGTLAIVCCFIERYLPEYEECDKPHYTQEQYVNDLMDVIFKSTKEGKELRYIERHFQRFFFNSMEARTDLIKTSIAKIGVGFCDNEIDLLKSEVEDVSWRTKYYPSRYIGQVSYIYQNILANKILPLLEKQKNTGSEEDQAHYRVLIRLLHKLLND